MQWCDNTTKQWWPLVYVLYTNTHVNLFVFYLGHTSHYARFLSDIL